jgi:hypothetical protein
LAHKLGLYPTFPEHEPADQYAEISVD